jgi:HSP20 family molecular chaperone IbpA
VDEFQPLVLAFAAALQAQMAYCGTLPCPYAPHTLPADDLIGINSNVSEDADALYVTALAPGLDPGAIQLTVQDNRLTIAGEKQRVAAEIQPEAFHRSERAAGTFVRTVTLPIDVEYEQVQAEYKNGLLVITLPKAEQAKPQQIAVSFGA